MLEIERKLMDKGIVVVLPDGQELRFYVVEIRSNRVKLGFSKFSNFKVYRAELYDKILEAKKQPIKMWFDELNENN